MTENSNFTLTIRTVAFTLSYYQHCTYHSPGGPLRMMQKFSHAFINLVYRSDMGVPHSGMPTCLHVCKKSN